MAEQSDDKARRDSQTPQFMGRGRAVLTVMDIDRHFDHWKTFFKVYEQDLPEPLIDAIEDKASYDNYSVEGKVRVEWPEVILEFNLDRFLGIRRERGSKERPIIISSSQNFATIIHPFSVDKEWFKGLDSKDVKRLNGYEWMFEQNQDDFRYKGHVRKGREMFITFDFGPDRKYHKYQGK